MELFTRAPGHARMNIPPDPTSRAATRSTIRWAVVAAYNANPPRWRNVTEEKRTPVLPPITTAFCATAPSEREMERRKERERRRKRWRWRGVLGLGLQLWVTNGIDYGFGIELNRYSLRTASPRRHLIRRTVHILVRVVHTYVYCRVGSFPSHLDQSRRPIHILQYFSTHTHSPLTFIIVACRELPLSACVAVTAARVFKGEVVERDTTGGVGL